MSFTTTDSSSDDSCSSPTKCCLPPDGGGGGGITAVVKNDDDHDHGRGNNDEFFRRLNQTSSSTSGRTKRRRRKKKSLEARHVRMWRAALVGYLADKRNPPNRLTTMKTAGVEKTAAETPQLAMPAAAIGTDPNDGPTHPKESVAENGNLDSGRKNVNTDDPRWIDYDYLSSSSSSSPQTDDFHDF